MYTSPRDVVIPATTTFTSQILGALDVTYKHIISAAEEVAKDQYGMAVVTSSEETCELAMTLLLDDNFLYKELDTSGRVSHLAACVLSLTHLFTNRSEMTSSSILLSPGSSAVLCSARDAPICTLLIGTSSL